MDNSANIPNAVNGTYTTQAELVYSDKVAPQTNSKIFSSDTKPIIDFNYNAIEKITSSLVVKTIDRGERLNDISVNLNLYKNRLNIYLGYGTNINLGDRVSKYGEVRDVNNVKTGNLYVLGTYSIDQYAVENSVKLGTQTDDREGCNGTDIYGRRLGICEDGVYNFTTRYYDTAGNVSAVKYNSIERDTVAPAAPTVSAVADEDNMNVSLKVSGESGTVAVISGASSNEGPIANLVGGIWKGNYVYNGTYTWNVRLKDKAGNMSPATEFTYKTKAAPVYTSYSMSDLTCPNPTPGKLVLPFVGIHDINSSYQAFEEGRESPHQGIDYDLKYEKVISSAAGTVRSVGWDNVGGGGWMITIDHGDGLITWYAHLSEWFVKVGDPVIAGTYIAKSGNSGVTTGEHLHFQVMKNGVSVNPNDYLYSCEKVEQPPIKEKIEGEIEGFQGTAGNPWNGKTYADILAQKGLKNTIDVYMDASGKVKSTNMTDTNSYLIYTDNTQSDKMIVYGISMPKNSTINYKIHKPLPNGQCMISGVICEGESITEKVVTNSSTSADIFLSDRITVENKSNSSSTLLASSYGKVTNIDSLGRWSIELKKVGENKYKADNSQNVVDLASGISLMAFSQLSFISSEFSNTDTNWFTVYNTKSNMKALAPQYKFEKIDQDLYVTGNWVKEKEAYYDDTYLDTRIVKLIPVGNIPANPTKINIVTHGWDKEGPSSTIRYDLKDSSKQNEGWVNWMNGGAKYDGLNYTVEENSDNSAKIANNQSSNDTTTLNLVLVWRDASVDLRKSIEIPKWDLVGFGGAGAPTIPGEASKWIVPVAEVVTKHLNRYISGDPEKPAEVKVNSNIPINCTGHSLGSLLCNEAGNILKNKYSRNTSKLVTLDAPAEPEGDIPLVIVPLTKHVKYKYNLDGRTKNEIDYTNYFSKNYTNSTSYYGISSLCGNADLSKSADIAVAMNFVNYNYGGLSDAIPPCSIHGKVVETYLEMVKGNRKVVFSDISENITLVDMLKSSEIVKGNIGGIAWGFVGSQENINFMINVGGNDNKFVDFVVRKMKDGSEKKYLPVN